MEFCKKHEESKREVSFEIYWFRIVCWVWMQVDMGNFNAREVFLKGLIGFLSLGRILKNPIGSDL
jgi:hypothetical protein